MSRDNGQLREIAQQMLRRLDVNHPGCAMIGFFFDARGPADRAVSIVLHGVNEEAAAKMLRHHADIIERSAATSPLAINNGPLIVKPS